jgi:hypothetical protein
VTRINPTVNATPMFRAINSKYAYTKTATEEFQENVMPFGDAVKIDNLIIDDPTHLFKPGPTEMEQKAQQMARVAIDTMIWGDPTVIYGQDGDSNNVFRPGGIVDRLTNPANYKMDSTTTTDMGGLDLTAITTTIANDFIDEFNDQIDKINPTFALGNRYMWRKVTRILRFGGGLDTTTDAYNRSFESWKGVRLINPGWKYMTRDAYNLADTSAWMMPWEAVTTGIVNATLTAGNRYGRILFVRTGEQDFTMLEAKGLQVRGPELLPIPEDAQGYLIKWTLGFACMDFRPLAQMKNIKIG